MDGLNRMVLRTAGGNWEVGQTIYMDSVGNLSGRPVTGLGEVSIPVGIAVGKEIVQICGDYRDRLIPPVPYSPAVKEETRKQKDIKRKSRKKALKDTKRNIVRENAQLQERISYLSNMVANHARENAILKREYEAVQRRSDAQIVMLTSDETTIRGLHMEIRKLTAAYKTALALVNGGVKIEHCTDPIETSRFRV